MKSLVIPSMLVLALLSGCDNDPGKGKTNAAVGAPVPAPVTPAPAPGATTSSFAISPGDSSIEFTGAKVTGKHDVKIKEFSGTIQVVDGDPTKSNVKVSMALKSLETEPAKFQAHLMSPDLLDVEKFPTATFQSTSITAGGADGATHTVTGNLMVHGETKSITFPAKIDATAEKVKVDAEFVIDRKDFGVTYPGMPDDLIKDQVLVRLKLEAKKG